MNLIILYDNEQHEQLTYIVEGERARHIFEVLGAKPGSTIRVGVLNGARGSATVLETSAARAVLSCSFESAPPRLPRVDMLIAIPRPRTLQKLLPEVTSMGVTGVTLMRTWRVAKPFLEASILTPERYRLLLHKGLMQGRLTVEPEVRIARRFQPFIEDELPRMFPPETIKIVAHPTTDVHMGQLSMTPDSPVAVAIGPEGGFIPKEVEAFKQAGFIEVGLGPYPLRVETACVAALSQVQLVRSLGA